MITENGTFYTFTVVVQSNVTGSGILSLDPANGGFVAAFDADDNPVTIVAGSDVSFSVGAAAVPEPGTLVMSATAALAVVLARLGYIKLCLR